MKLSFFQGFNIDPVDAVDQHGRDSLVAAVEPSYSFQDHEQSSDSVEQSDVSFSDSIPHPNDSDKKLAIGYLNIHEHFWATNGSCDYHVSNNADHSNSASSEVINLAIAFTHFTLTILYYALASGVFVNLHKRCYRHFKRPKGTATKS